MYVYTVFLKYESDLQNDTWRQMACMDLWVNSFQVLFHQTKYIYIYIPNSC